MGSESTAKQVKVVSSHDAAIENLAALRENVRTFRSLIHLMSSGCILRRGCHACTLDDHVHFGLADDYAVCLLNS